MPPWPAAAFAVKAITVVVIAVFTARTLVNYERSVDAVTDTLGTIEQIDAVLAAMMDAETGQRGFLLTGEPGYLDPYNQAVTEVPTELATLRTITSDDPEQQGRLDEIDRLVRDKLSELDLTVRLGQQDRTADAIARVRTGRGKAAMDRLRVVLRQMRDQERAELEVREADLEATTAYTRWVGLGGSALVLLLIGVTAVTTSADYRTRLIEGWVRAGQGELATRIQGELRPARLGELILRFLADYAGAAVGAVYLAEPDGSLRRLAAHALPASAAPEAVRPGEGLLGQAAKDNRARHVSSVPKGYLRVESAVGGADVRELLVAPAAVDGAVQAVVELGFANAVPPEVIELANRVSEMLGVAIRTSRDRARLEELLAETTRQSEALRVTGEELRRSNRDLEQQTRALEESQSRLEVQQVELEQSNARLGDQTRALEAHRDELERSEHELRDKAVELERANQYKSEFMANMSHELRTPLNSSLILAKLLADNKGGNLTEEQVKFARTILSAGKDLLALINDILDLSKIEAGRLEVHAEPVDLHDLLDGLRGTFEASARQKGLELSIALDEGTPARMVTDGQRLAQILRNLVANAIKFTDAGQVSVRVSGGLAGVSFAVRDTGIGIAPHQHEVVFEAFRQADGSTHRRFGGTGLGLSISRDLARLLGGDVTLESRLGEGSTFTLTLPLTFAPTAVVRSAPSKPPRPVPPPIPIEDDRRELGHDGGAGDARVVLVVEDDGAFASILRDLARELGFRCVVAQTGADAIEIAVRYRPSAILLDLNLPDRSGLGVLDELKGDPRTRHVPVHVLSARDATREALELGAVGYAVKPVDRDQLVDAFRRLEAKLAPGGRRVLVVERDPVEGGEPGERLRPLIDGGEVEGDPVEGDPVEFVGASTADEALARLRESTFDCVVLDLARPDGPGHELLERLTSSDDLPFPPVIVYTGRELSRDDEQRLRRYSRSIVLKDARSPERLLDEVTLFLHQVEANLPPERQRMLRQARDRDAALDGRRILVVEDDVRNVFALTSVLEPGGARVEIARNGREALEVLARSPGGPAIDLVLMDLMMPEMDGLTAIREIRRRPEWRQLPIIALTAKAMHDDQVQCLEAGANDYIAKPLDVERLLSLVRVWMPRRA